MGRAKGAHRVEVLLEQEALPVVAHRTQRELVAALAAQRAHKVVLSVHGELHLVEHPRLNHEPAAEIDAHPVLPLDRPELLRRHVGRGEEQRIAIRHSQLQEPEHCRNHEAEEAQRRNRHHATRRWCRVHAAAWAHPGVRCGLTRAHY